MSIQNNLRSISELYKTDKLEHGYIEIYDSYFKDLRNKAESTNPASILDGNIDMFIEEGIKNK